MLGLEFGFDDWASISGGGEPPVNTIAPVASGTGASGQTLSVTDGTWTGTLPITYTYQWRSDTVNIGGATSDTFLVTASEENTNVDCVVTHSKQVCQPKENIYAEVEACVYYWNA